jgi:hypothetical protein
MRRAGAQLLREMHHVEGVLFSWNLRQSVRPGTGVRNLEPELLAGSPDGAYVGRNFARDPDESSGTELTNSSTERAGERLRLS